MTSVTLVGYHFPKTGGTSIGSHAFLQLGKDQHCPYGRHNATRRLYSSEPLLEEYPPGDIAKLLFIFGHSVTFSTLELLPRNNVELFTVCRHPVSRFVSSYKHRLRYRRGEIGVSARRFFMRQRPSPFAHEMLTRFAPLADPRAVSKKDKLISILQGVRFIVTTEMLNERSIDLFASIGLPPLSEKRRAYNEAVDLGDLTAEDIIRRDHLDMMVYEAVNNIWTSGGAPTELRNNPFGYQPERLLKARRALAKEKINQKRAVRRAYFDLFTFHANSGRLHATKVFLERAGLPSAREAFAAFCAKRSFQLQLSDLSARSWCYVSEAYDQLGDLEGQRHAAESALAVAPKSALTNLLAGRAAAQLGDRSRAISLLSTATKLNPRMQEAWYWLARVSWKNGDAGIAAHAIERAIALKPDAEPFQNLHQAIVNGRDDEADIISPPQDDTHLLPQRSGAASRLAARARPIRASRRAAQLSPANEE